MRFRILFLTFHSEIGGGETSLITLIKNLDKSKFEPIVIVAGKGEFYKKLISLNIKVQIIPLPGYLIRTFFVPGISFKGFFNFWQAVDKIKPDLIHVNNSNLIIYAGIAGKLKKIPVLVSAHGPWDSYYFFQDILNNFFADKILANTQKTASFLTKREIIKDTKVEILYFGIDTDFFKPRPKAKARQKLKLPPSGKVVSILGRIDPVKDFLTFFEAADIVLKNYSKVMFYIAGSVTGNFSNDNQEQEKIKNYLGKNPKLKKQTFFGGFRDDTDTVINASDLLVSSSLSESFGLSLAEALSSRIPVVATNQGGQNLLVKNGKNGFLVPPRNPQMMAEKIILLLKNPLLSKKFGDDGRKHILANFSLKDYLKKVQKNYLDLITKNV